MGDQSPGSVSVDFWFDLFDLFDDVERLGVQVNIRATLDAGLDPRPYVAEALLTVHEPDPGDE
ncbi:MAG: hypothetical protein V5A62_02400 [Haloarculaceae archaeon]